LAEYARVVLHQPVERRAPGGNGDCIHQDDSLEVAPLQEMRRRVTVYKE
jgi:hypothetical protein